MQEFPDTTRDEETPATEPALPDPAASPNEESGRRRSRGGTAAGVVVAWLPLAGALLALVVPAPY